MTRREIVGIGVGTVALLGTDVAHAQNLARAVASVEALVFDTFGTVVDWRGSIIAEGDAWGKTRGIAVDWARFADRWRAGYTPSMERVRKGEIPWTNLDHLHRALLEDLLTEFRIEGLSEEEKDHWNRVWHRLKPWPDSVAGLTRLKKKYTIAPLSNGNVALLAEMAKHSRYSVGPHPFGRAGETLQARSRSLPHCGQPIGVEARRSDDVRGALRRSDVRTQFRSAHRIHPPAQGIRTHAQGGRCQDGQFRRGIRRHGGFGVETWRVTLSRQVAQAAEPAEIK